MDPLILGAILLMIASANSKAPAANPGTPGYKPPTPPLQPTPPKSSGGGAGSGSAPGGGGGGAKSSPGTGSGNDPIMNASGYSPIPFSNDPSQFNIPAPDLTGAGQASADAGFTGITDVEEGNLLNAALSDPSTSGVTLADPNAGLGDLAGGIDPLTGELVDSGGGGGVDPYSFDDSGVSFDDSSF